jgi:hypothetical protein
MTDGNSRMTEQFYKKTEHYSKIDDRISVMADKIIKWPSTVANAWQDFKNGDQNHKMIEHCSKNDWVQYSYLQIDKHCSSGKWLSTIAQWKMAEHYNTRNDWVY